MIVNTPMNTSGQVMENHYKIGVMTRIVIPLANLFCRVWQSYDNLRHKNNFDFYIEDLKKTFTNSVTYHKMVGSRGFYEKTKDLYLCGEELTTYRFWNIQITVSRSLPQWGEPIWTKQRQVFINDLIDRATSGQSLLNKEGTDEQRKTTS